jgi:oligopeptidase B
MNPTVLIFLSFILTHACTSTDSSQALSHSMKAPIAKQQQHIFHEFNNSRIDNYYWLMDDSRSDQQVLAYLNDENQYADFELSSEKQLISQIYSEIKQRLPNRDQSVPAKIDDYWYYSRYAKNKEYPIYARKLNSLESEEEIMLDMNQRAEQHKYFYSNYQAVSPNHKIVGFSEDTNGNRNYSLRFKNLENNQLYADVIEKTTGEIVWGLDNKTFFYVKKHPITLLPFQVYRHELGGNNKDELVYEEKDNTFYISIGSSKSKKYIYIYVGSTTSSEVLVLDASTPKAAFQSFLAREENHEYSVTEYEDVFYILSNWKAKNFRVMKSLLAYSNDKSNWQSVIESSDDSLIYEVDVINNFLLIEQRTNGIRGIKVHNLETNKSQLVGSNESTYTMNLDFNPNPKSSWMRYSFSSLTTPSSVYDYNLESGESLLLKQDDVLGGYDSNQYQSQRLSILVRDNETVPVSLVYKKQATELKNRPILIYAYGSYGLSVDPEFSYSRVSLLDRGFIFAIAHVRGSQAKGRTWYENGRMLHKKNTFYDFIDVSKGLLAKNYGDKNKVFAMGGSAGGLLMGAVANMEGMLYRGIIAQVPFVDVVTTMLDEDIPLTTGEFSEWGNPKIEEYYQYMLSYSPYDQVKKQAYPNIYVSTGLYDSQVQYWEPAKWVAKLRDMKTDSNLLLMRTNMEAGHGGASGRYQVYHEIAEEYGFLMKLLK